jgi:ABC-type sugar transport system ATPase subunit
MVAIRLEGIKKSFGLVEVLMGLDFTIEHGEFVVFVGPSGCGKSTLLRIIAGLELPSSGEVYFGDTRFTNVAPAKRGVGMVFQSYALYPHMNVAENMTMSLRLAGVPKPQRRTRAAEVAEMLQLVGLLDRKPGELSGGQRQRVAIGRALIRQPDVYLFDEPLSNLDAALRVETRVGITKLHRSLGATMVYVTHDQVEAMTMADRIVILDEGRVAQIGTPMELYRNPATRFIAGFIGSPKMNFFDVTETRRDGAQILATLKTGEALKIDVPAVPETPIGTIGIRPEHLSIAPDGQLPGRVVAVEHLGSETLIYVETGAGTSIIKTEAVAPAEADDTVRLHLQPEFMHLFGADGASIVPRNVGEGASGRGKN